MLPHISLKSQREKSVLRKHPWVFSGAIAKTPPGLVDGSLVEVHDSGGRCLGVGHYFTGSIAVRLFSFEEVQVDDAFWEKKLRDAINLRAQLGLLASERTTAFRLVNAEGDGLSGLVIDLYGDTAVLQCHSVGMWNVREALCRALRTILGSRLRAIFDKSSDVLLGEQSTRSSDSYLFGARGTGEVLENGHRFRIDWEEGQKTGFFLDQRENREIVGHYAAGRTVLNCFSYSGGFSVYALHGGAITCHSIDSSKAAIELANRNIELNGLTARHQSSTVECLPFLQNANAGADLIVLDPPAFAKHLRHADQALKGYRHINEAAFRALKSGGLLFTFSCSQAVDRSSFRSVVFSAAVNAQRSVRVLRELGHGPDHPVSLFHPEGEYLKGLLLEVS